MKLIHVGLRHNESRRISVRPYIRPQRVKRVPLAGGSPLHLGASLTTQYFKLIARSNNLAIGLREVS